MTIDGKFYRELRCPNCRRLLYYEYVYAGRVAINCRSCDELVEVTFKHPKTKENIDVIDKEFTAKNEAEKSQQGKGVKE